MSELQELKARVSKLEARSSKRDDDSTRQRCRSLEDAIAGALRLIGQKRYVQAASVLNWALERK